jgi:hypothetical protein
VVILLGGSGDVGTAFRRIVGRGFRERRGGRAQQTEHFTGSVFRELVRVEQGAELLDDGDVRGLVVAAAVVSLTRGTARLITSRIASQWSAT